MAETGPAADPQPPIRVAYLVNRYPAVSHSFIRREIAALERAGVEVARIAVRGWDGPLVDPEDIAERQRTRYVLERGIAPLLSAAIRTALAGPRLFARAMREALHAARGSDRALPFHLAYLAEACIVSRWLREAGIGHVHAHFGTNSAEVARLAAPLAGASYSFTVHGPEEFDRPAAIGLGRKVRAARFVIGISSFTRSQLFRWVEPGQWPKIEVVHCGLDTSFRDVSPDPPAIGAVLVCVGRLSEQKGHLLLLEAMQRVFERGRRFSLVLAGDGELRPAIESRAAALGLAAQVRITGWIGGADVRRELLGARALVLPSFAEGLPVVLMEAMALGRPVVTTFVAGIPELVVDGECGWLVPAGDAESLAAAIEACLDADAAVLARMGAAARARAVDRHDVDVEAGKLARLFRQALARVV